MFPGGIVLDLIDDDEWFELGLALSNTMARMPLGSTLVEALQIPPFRLAISATGGDLESVVTRPYLLGLTTPAEAVRGAIDLALSENRPSEHALSLAITQTDDGEHYAIAVVGIPGEQKSWTTFGLGPGGHSIDVGYLVLDELEGWVVGLRPSGPKRQLLTPA